MEKGARPWDFRAVQLDLARQMETVDFICEFVDFIAAYDYNVLALYLEGRVRTASFPHRAAAESYSPEEMKRVVDHAAAKGIDVVPVVSTLGHCGMFLRVPELAHLSETRDNAVGRFGNRPGAGSVFCSSLPGTFTFFEQYLTELSAIFPSPYFHAGFDEAWDMGVCPLCRERARAAGGEAALFAKHILETHRIVTGTLGKRLILWDDMFEFYDDALEALPRDIVLCTWQYDSLVDIPRAHFANRRREDLFSRYAREGFSYLCAPGDYSARNVATFTAYAERHAPLGGWLTSWEKSCSFQYEAFPVMAFTGRLWAGEPAAVPESVLDGTTAALLGVQEEAFVKAVAGYAGTRPRVAGGQVGSYLRGVRTEREQERASFSSLLLGVLGSQRQACESELGRRVLADMRFTLEREEVHHCLRDALPVTVDPQASPAQREPAREVVRGCIAKVEGLLRRGRELWAAWRPGIEPCHLEAHFEALLENLRAHLEAPPPPALLRVFYLLPDAHSRACVSLRLRFAGDAIWHEVADGVFKGIHTDDANYQWEYPLETGGVPETLRIEATGFGGQGVTGAEVVTAEAVYAPSAIARVWGRVTEPANLLVPDLTWAYLGERDTTYAFQHPGLSAAPHGVDFTLAPRA